MRADRLIATLLMLHQRGRLSATQIAAALDVSPRTVMRDIEALSTAGVPIVALRGPLGGFELMPGFRGRFAALTIEQAHAITSGQPTTSPRVDHTFLRDPEPMAGERAGESIAFLRAAIRGRRVVQGRHPTWGRARASLYPLALVDKAGTWFLVADLSDRRTVCTVSDIQALAGTGRRFRRPADFDLPVFWHEWLAAQHGRRAP